MRKSDNKDLRLKNKDEGVPNKVDNLSILEPWFYLANK